MAMKLGFQMRIGRGSLSDYPELLRLLSLSSAANFRLWRFEDCAWSGPVTVHTIFYLHANQRAMAIRAAPLSTQIDGLVEAMQCQDRSKGLGGVGTAVGEGTAIRWADGSLEYTDEEGRVIIELE